MKAAFSSVLVACLLTFALVPATVAAPVSMPSLAQILAAASGDPTVPSAWAGVWQVADSTHACGSSVITGTNFDVDTLCTGEPVALVPGSDCSGTVDDDNVNVVCSYTEEIETGCTATTSFSVIGTRSGNSYYVETTFSITFDPPGCFFGSPDTCETTEHTGTRIDDEPVPCTSPVVPTSWGRMKASYR